MKYTLLVVGGLIVLALACIYVYATYLAPKPVYLNPTATLEGADVQPQEALAIAEPYLEEHGTVVFNEDEPLQTHIVAYKEWYYVMKTNYPAKTHRYYLQPAVRVHMSTGEVTFSEKE